MNKMVKILKSLGEKEGYGIDCRNNILFMV